MSWNPTACDPTKRTWDPRNVAGRGRARARGNYKLRGKTTPRKERAAEQIRHILFKPVSRSLKRSSPIPVAFTLEWSLQRLQIAQETVAVYLRGCARVAVSRPKNRRDRDGETGRARARERDGCTNCSLHGEMLQGHCSGIRDDQTNDLRNELDESTVS